MKQQVYKNSLRNDLLNITDDNQNATSGSVSHGGGVVSLNETGATNSSNRVSSAPDEQGIRAFLFKLLNSRHIFSTHDIVDQVEAFL